MSSKKVSSKKSAAKSAPAKKPAVKKPAAKPAAKSAAKKPAAKPAAKSAKPAPKAAAKKSAAKPAAKPVAKPSKSAKPAPKAAAKKPAAKPASKPAKAPAKSAKPAAKPAAKPQKPAAKSTSKAPAKPAPKAPAKKPAAKPVAKPAAKPAKPAPKPAAKPAAKVAKPAPKAANAPAAKKAKAVEPEAKVVKKVAEVEAPAAVEPQPVAEVAEETKGKKSGKEKVEIPYAVLLEGGKKLSKSIFFFEIDENEERANKKKVSSEMKNLDMKPTSAIRHKISLAEETQEELTERLLKELEEQNLAFTREAATQICTRCNKNLVSPEFWVDKHLGYCEECAAILKLGQSKEARKVEYQLGAMGGDSLDEAEDDSEFGEGPDAADIKDAEEEFADFE